MDIETKKELKEAFQKAMQFPWPQNVAYAAYGERALSFNQDQMDGVIYAIDERHRRVEEWWDIKNQLADREYLHLYFKDGLPARKIAEQFGVGAETVNNHLFSYVKGLRQLSLARYVLNGLSVQLAAEKEVERADLEREHYLETHPLERNLRSWGDKLDLSMKTEWKLHDFERAGVKTLGDFIDKIDFTAKRPYAKLQASIRGVGDTAMREIVEQLRTVVDIPPFDPKEREALIDSKKVLDDYAAAKALGMFDENMICHALKEKYHLSASGLNRILGKDQNKEKLNISVAFAQILDDCHFFGLAKQYQDFSSWVAGEGTEKVADEILAGWGTDGSIEGNSVHQILDSNIGKSNEELHEILKNIISDHIRILNQSKPSLSVQIASAKADATPHVQQTDILMRGSMPESPEER